ncbi:MAG: sensor histidine kinase [Stappiaceae bacterium]
MKVAGCGQAGGNEGAYMDNLNGAVSRTAAGVRLLGLYVFLVLFVGLFPKEGVAGVVKVEPGAAFDNIFSHMVPVADASFDLSNAEDRAKALAAHTQSPSEPVGEGAVADGSWVYVTLSNKGKEQGIWRLDTRLTFTSGFRFYTVRDGVVRRVLTAEYPYVPFKNRESGDVFFASSPIVIDPGASVQLWAELVWGGIPGIMRIRLVPETTFDSQRIADTIWDAAYFGAGLTFVFFFIAFSLLLNSRPARWYALFYFMLVSFYFYSRGYLGQFILTDNPTLLLELTRPYQAAIVIAYLIFVMAFMGTRQFYPNLHRFILGLIGLAVILTVLEKVVDWHRFADLALAISLVFAATCAYSAYVSVRDGKPGSWFFALGVAILFAYVGVGVFGVYAIFYDGHYIVTQFTVAAQLLDGTVFAIAIVIQTFALRRERDEAVRAELQVSKERLEISDRLLKARDDLDSARRLAEQRREKLSMTSHDLRQPLTSLRLALNEARDQAPDLGDKLGAGLDYLDGILDTTLAESRPKDLQMPGNEASLDNPHEIAPQPDALSLQLIFDNIERMFADEAAAKGLRFTVMPTSVSVLVEPVPLIRMTSNLVSNAIRYTQTGGIVVGARIRNGHCNVEVWDTGPGLDEAEQIAIRAKYQRGGHAGNETGEGLGLASVEELAGHAGAELAIRSRKKYGSVFAINGLQVGEN